MVSTYNKDNHFIRLSQYQLAQWVDVQSQRFVNFFLISTTSTKYQLLGVADLLAENYEVVMQNNLPTRGQFTKQLVITEVNGLGIENHLLGFTLFSYGICIYIQVFCCFFCMSICATVGRSDFALVMFLDYKSIQKIIIYAKYYGKIFSGTGVNHLSFMQNLS